ncbi:MAG: BamA/TamA family outer membrane protein [Bacteroidetes bacterium]|nr:BamA/TamA family outer membrane protein [Bacteroidota bacterium]
MYRRRQVTASFFKPVFLLPIILIPFFFSCTTASKVPKNQPFVFATNIKVEGNLPSSQKTDLSARLANQLDDSLRTQIRSILGVYNEVMYPPVFDTANVRRSIGYMVALLNATGYYNPAIKDTVRRDTVKIHHWFSSKRSIQYRVTVDFDVFPGKQVKLDSIGYDLSTPALQALTLESRPQSLLKKGKPYSNQLLSAELDRLVNLFRNNGYYSFSKEDLVIVKDTVVAALIDPNLDPFQQAALLEELRKKRENPTINVVVEQRPVRDSAHLMKYTVGRVTVYPDLPILLDDTVTISNIDTSTAPGFTIISRSDKFKPSILTSNVRLRPGRLYRQENTVRTLNRFNLMGAWQQATINFTPSDSADSILDVTLRLYPAKKQFLNADLEAARNTNDIVTTTNLFGMNVNLGLRNRNAFKQSVLTSTNLRGGIELGSDFIQTTQASISHSISFPKLLPAPPFIRRQFRMDSLRTIINANASYIDRRQFFTVKSFNASFGWEWSVRNKTFLWRPLNVEYTKLDKTDSFSRFLTEIPSLNLAFKSGLVLSQQFVYKSVKKTSERRTNFLTVSAESSGALAGFIRALDEGDLWRFVKGEIDFRHHIDYRRSQLAFHAYGGFGLAYGREGASWEQTLPFYKAFFAGGPNSMRGWQVRQLGLGSSKFYDTARGGQLDRFGDIQLEGNVEYRFPLGTILGVKFLSALYVDAGNIWNRFPIDKTPEQQGSDFQLIRFYKEIAVDAGTGLRVDFDWFLIRLDWAYKIKDPQNLNYSDKWFHGMQLFKGQFQLGIGYPF